MWESKEPRRVPHNVTFLLANLLHFSSQEFQSFCLVFLDLTLTLTDVLNLTREYNFYCINGFMAINLELFIYGKAVIFCYYEFSSTAVSFSSWMDEERQDNAMRAQSKPTLLLPILIYRTTLHHFLCLTGVSGGP